MVPSSPTVQLRTMLTISSSSSALSPIRSPSRLVVRSRGAALPAERPDLQQRLRQDPSLLRVAIDEILRIHAPLIANRRVATGAVEIGGREIGAGERITLIWASANRDEGVFGDPDEFRLDRDPAENLLYGAGIHVCPGAPLRID